MTTKRLWQIGWIAAVLVGLLYSARWIVPSTLALFSSADYKYAPTYFPEGNSSDDYFYYAKVRDVIDGNWLSHDPITVEHRYEMTTHSSYLGSYWLAALPALISGSTLASLAFNNFFYPFMAFICFFSLLMLINNKNALNLWGAILSTFGGMFWIVTDVYYDSTVKGHKLIEGLGRAFFWNGDLARFTALQRFPNLQVMGPMILLFATLLFIADKKENRRWPIIFGAALILSFGVLTGGSSLIFLCLFGLFYLVQVMLARQKSKWLLLIGALGLPAILFAVWVMITSLKAIAYNTNLANETDLVETVPLYVLIASIAYLAFPLLMLRKTTASLTKRWIIAVCAAAICGFFIIHFKSGYAYSSRYVSRGIELIVAAAGILAIFSLPKVVGWGQKNHKYYQIVLPFMILIGGCIGQARIAFKNSEKLNNPALVELCDWFKENVNTDSVLVTLDADLMVNLPACSPVSLYVPQALISSASRPERLSRWSEVVKFYGVEKWHDLLSFEGPSSKAQAKQMRLILFYGQFYRTDDLSAKATDEIEKAFTEAKELKFKADYLLVTPFDMPLIRAGSRAEKVVKEQKPVFTNRGSAIYKLN